MIEIVKFWATWCWPCKMITPILKEIWEEYGYNYTEVNIEEEPELTQYKWVTSIPTIVINRNGVEIGRLTWAQPKEHIVQEIEIFKTSI